MAAKMTSQIFIPRQMMKQSLLVVSVLLLGEVEVKPVKITIITYYAWNNRQEPKMRVWLPLFIGER